MSGLVNCQLAEKIWAQRYCLGFEELTDRKSVKWEQLSKVGLSVMGDGVFYDSDNNSWHLLKAYSVEDLALRDLRALWSHLILQAAPWVVTIIIPTLQMKKKVHRTVKVLTKFTQLARIQPHVCHLASSCDLSYYSVLLLRNEGPLERNLAY